MGERSPGVNGKNLLSTSDPVRAEHPTMWPAPRSGRRDSSGTTHPTGPANHPRPMGDNLWITGRRTVGCADGVNSTGGGLISAGHADVSDVGAGNGVTHNFSPGPQGTLCPTKLFGIIRLFERRRWLSTAACPLYDGC